MQRLNSRRAAGDSAVRTGLQTFDAADGPLARSNPTDSPAPFDGLTWALIAAILCYVWRIQDLYPILATIRAPILSTAAVLVLFVIDVDRRRTLRTVRHRITTWVLTILALAVLSVPLSLYQGLSFRFIVDDFGKSVLLFVVLVASIRTMIDVRRFVAALAIGGVIYAQYVYFNIPMGLGGRLGNIAYYDANDLGMLLVSTMPMLLFFLFRGKLILARIASAIAVLLFVLMIVKTGSRGAFISLTAVALYMLFLLNIVTLKVRLGAVVVSIIMLTAFASDQYWDMMGTLLNPQDDYNWSGGAETGRMEVWKRGMGYMLDRPLTGVGAAAFSVAEGTISPLADRQEYGIGLKWSAAHNSFVEIGAELGVGGLVVFILLIGTAFVQARRIGRHRGQARKPSDDAVLGHALAAAVVGYAVGGFFLSQAYSVYALVLFGIIAAMARATGTSLKSGGRPRIIRQRMAIHGRERALS